MDRLEVETISQSVVSDWSWVWLLYLSYCFLLLLVLMLVEQVLRLLAGEECSMATDSRPCPSSVDSDLYQV